MQWHPDKNPGDSVAEQRFKAISEAYDCLKDPQKRAAYDRYGKAAFQQGGGGGGAAARRASRRALATSSPTSSSSLPGAAASRPGAVRICATTSR